MIELLKTIFGKELGKVIKKEQEESEYLSNDDYESNLDRADAGLDEAIRQVRFVAALKCAEHRKAQHGDKCDEEIEMLRVSIDPEYLAMADRTAEWWNN